MVEFLSGCVLRFQRAFILLGDLVKVTPYSPIMGWAVNSDSSKLQEVLMEVLMVRRGLCS